jgi:hypothetical protein
MLRAAVVGTVVAALALGGCGDDAADEGGESRPAATATATPASREYYEAMDELVSRLDRAVAAAIAGEADAVKRIEDVVKDAREELREHRAAGGGESEAGNLVLTTAASARDYARNGEQEGLKLVRRIPIVEARDFLQSEASSQ